jgi:NADH dehydrogenase [ubiquinone] 1 alpha subcomplex assembly factor 7
MPVAERLARLIRSAGPISVAQYMAVANAHYYATRDPLGAAGDFTTAPEISQMFGELIGLALADLWRRAGAPAGAVYVELGPGRGTLAADALRAMAKTGLDPRVALVETSPVLRHAQARLVPGARWHEDLATLPGDGPLLVVANEFFDALPAHQWIATAKGWRERMVACGADGFVPVAGAPVPASALPAALRATPPGTVVEASPAALAIVRQIAGRLAAQGGAALILDYGHEGSAAGDTLQAVSRHAFADPWREPGERDLTVHVDFQALGAAARGEGARLFGPIGQGAWLTALGIEARAEALARAAPDRAEAIHATRDRLVGPDAMGTLFKAMALTGAGWPAPAGFE